VLEKLTAVRPVRCIIVLRKKRPDWPNEEVPEPEVTLSLSSARHMFGYCLAPMTFPCNYGFPETLTSKVIVMSPKFM